MKTNVLRKGATIFARDNPVRRQQLQPRPSPSV